MDLFIFNYLNSWGDWIYVAIVFAMLIDGNVTMLVVGFLASGGVVNPAFGLGATFVGGFVEQLLWYWIGIKIRNNNHGALKWLKRVTNHFDEHFRHRPKLTLFISKFIYGLHRASLARVAVIGIKLKDFLKQSTPILVGWMLILFSVGYAISAPLYQLESYFKHIEIILLGLVIFIVLFERFVLSGKLKKFWQKL